MKLAEACGLTVAKSCIALIGGKRRYVCERFDRWTDSEGVHRLHQEDFCQLLRVDPRHKYEKLGGPGIAESLYPEVMQRMAMKIDGEYSFKWMSRSKFLRMAEKNGIAGSTMNKEITRMTKRITHQSSLIAARLAKSYPSPCYARICEGIISRVAQLTRDPESFIAT